MPGFMDNYFGSLNKDACIYFYILSIIFAFVFFMAIISVVTFGIKNYKKLDFMFLMNSTFLLFNTFLAYFVNRLLHTMCVNSVH